MKRKEVVTEDNNPTKLSPAQVKLPMKRKEFETEDNNPINLSLAQV